jgi:ribosomal protein L40E
MGARRTFGWDNPNDFVDCGITYYVHKDQDMKVRCMECGSQLATDGTRCELCAYAHQRRVGAR